ncbi:rootletin isoform X1 [Euwallacea fornicatus]|uniref:rootletin isoform X1 n=2 Tax=Euwallacea fornicatus TaxID=995702 RepID=UPI00338D96A7
MCSLRHLPPGSRCPVYFPEATLIPPRIDVGDADRIVPPPRPPPPVQDVFVYDKMLRPSIKKGEQAKMERKRPPIYRPKSRTDSSTVSGSRAESGRLRGDGGGGSSDEDLTRHQQDLRQRLQDEAALYRRRLETYRQAQQNQAALVSRLQAKVLQYKQRCADLEAQMSEYSEQPTSLKSCPSLAPTLATPSSTALEQAQQHLREVREERITDLDTALQRLLEERKKSEKLMQFNKVLRDQLEESHNTNEALTADLQKLTNDFESLREEMMLKEDDWKDEEQAFNDYYSTEHNRLLNLWRDVVSVKRHFMDVQSNAERDMNKLKADISEMGREMLMACSRMDTNVFTETLIGAKAKLTSKETPDYEKIEAEMDILKAEKLKYETDIQLKDDRIQQLLNEIQMLEERCVESDQNLSQFTKMQDEVDILEGALRDIAQALIQDAETKDAEILQATHLHLSASTPIPQKSPRRSGRTMAAPAAFAESTISAVQAALHKYQSFIHELQVKLQSNKEQLLLVRKQYENSESNVVALEKRAQELVSQLDVSRAQCSQLVQERDNLLKTMDSLKSDKNQLDRNRIDLGSMLDSVNQDYDKLIKANTKLQKDLDAAYQEKIFLQGEVDRLNQDADLREISLRGEEDRCSRIREELLTVREALHNMSLSHDMLEQQKSEADNVISSLEKIKVDYEVQLEKLFGESSNVQDSLLKKETIATNLELDKKKLQDDLKRVEEEKQAIQIQCNDHQNDIQSLRKELLQAEQQKLDFESEKMSLSEKCKFLDIEKEKIEMELNQAIRERNDLSNQLTVMGRKRDALNEEVMRCRQKLEQAGETNSRINRNLEELVKECEEKQCTIDGLDKDVQRLQELLAAVRSEKEALEAVLFDTQTNLEASEEKKMQLEKEAQDLLVKQEQLKSHVSKLTKDLERSEKRCSDVKTSMAHQAGNKEVEFKQTVEKLHLQNEENVKKLTEERDKIRVSLEKRMQNSMQQLGNEKNVEIQQLTDRVETLQIHIDNLCQQHEELMLRAENDKQQALLIAHHDQKALNDKFETARRDLEEEREALERLKREANSRFDQDRVVINQLKDELSKFKVRLEESKTRSEEEKIALQQKIEEIRIERDNAQNEVENLRVQLHLCEDKSESVSNLLHETTRKLKETENNSECLRKDLTDVRRLLTDSNFEKEKYHNSNKELRDHVKRTESEKRELNRQLEDAYQKLANLEETKSSLEHDRARLQNQIRDLEKDQLQTEHQVQSFQEELQRSQSAKVQQQQEEKELQAKLLNEVEERERSHQEVHQLRKQMSELERNLEQTRQELNRARSHTGQLEEQWHSREQDLLIHLEDSRVKEKRLEDQKHNLEVCLVDATQQIQELKAKLGGAEGKVRALETQLAQLESSKRDIEQKLFSVVSTLRRIGGIQMDGSVSMPYRLLSPSRRWSPARASHEEKDGGAIDVDPEVVRKGVRNLMQQVAQIERERDDYKTQVTTVKKQLQEAQDTQSKGDHKLTKIMQTLRTLQEEKGTLEAVLGQKNMELKSQSEALLKKTEEAKQMREKVVSLELCLSGESDQKHQYEEKIEKLKVALNRADTDKRNLQEELTRTESRSTKLELQRMSAEGDLQRLQMMLQEKDNAIQKLQEKCDVQSRSTASLEERCVSLKSTIDQLNCSLEKASNGESELKSELQRLQRNLYESASSQHSESERLKQMQKALSNCENERRILNERLEITQNNLAEMRRNNQILQDQVTRLNNELANNEVQKSALESQLRLAQWPADTPAGAHQEEELRMQLHSVQKERNDLRAKVDSMNNKLRQLEGENRNLERLASKPSGTLSKTKTYLRPEKSTYDGVDKSAYDRSEKTYEKIEKYSPLEKYDRSGPEKYELDASVTELDRYEQENRELRVRISRLEAELAEKDAELARLRTQRPSLDAKFDRAEIERYRAAQLQAERLLEAREQSHRQQISRLESQIKLLRDQLNEEIKRRQQYVLRSTKAGREMQQLRQALGDSLRTVSQDPSVDALLLEHEARKLDNTLSSTSSLPPALGLPSSLSYRRSMTPQPK